MLDMNLFIFQPICSIALSSFKVLSSYLVIYPNVSCFYIQHPKFHDIQIDHRSLSLCFVPCYTFCNKKFRDIKFDHRALKSPDYNLWPCFEARQYPLFWICLMILYHDFYQPLPHSILGHYFHRWFLTKPSQHCASIVPRPTKNNQSSTIYKLTTEIHHYSLFSVTHFESNFGDIQFDHWALTSPEYNLWPCFEARPTAFHTWPFLGISFAGWKVHEMSNA